MADPDDPPDHGLSEEEWFDATYNQWFRGGRTPEQRQELEELLAPIRVLTMMAFDLLHLRLFDEVAQIKEQRGSKDAEAFKAFVRYFETFREESREIRQKLLRGMERQLRRYEENVDSLPLFKMAIRGTVRTDDLALVALEAELATLLREQRARGDTESWRCAAEVFSLFEACGCEEGTDVRFLAEVIEQAQQAAKRKHWVNEHNGPVEAARHLLRRAGLKPAHVVAMKRWLRRSGAPWEQVAAAATLLSESRVPSVMLHHTLRAMGFDETLTQRLVGVTSQSEQASLAGTHDRREAEKRADKATRGRTTSGRPGNG